MAAVNNDNLPDDILPEEECAVPIAKHEAGIAEIAILKFALSIPDTQLNALAQVFFNTTHLQIERVNLVAGFDERYFAVSPSLPWPDFEKTIINYICERSFNFKLSNELKHKLSEYLNFEDFEKFQIMLSEHNMDGLNEMLRDFIIRHYATTDFRLVLELETITEYEFTRERAPDEETILMDENGTTELDTQVVMGQGDVVIAPVMGVSVLELEVGDRIFVRVFPDQQLFGYGATKPPQQETVIRSITHDDISGHTLIVETREGKLVRILEREDIKIKCVRQNTGSYFGQVFSTIFNWYILFFIAAFILIYFIFLV